MDNQLGLLISTYEDEVQQLQKQLDDCLWKEDVDYIGAYYCKIALRHTQDQLSRLKRFDDPLYDKKSHQTMLIEGSKKRIAGESDLQMKAYYEEVLQKEKQKLDALNQTPIPESNPVKEKLLTSTLLRLIKGEVKNVKLILHKYENLLLHFSYKTKKLTITLPYLKKHVSSYNLGSYEIDYLQVIGFQLAQNENKLVMSLFGKSEDLFEQLNILMLKIVFGVFRYKGFRDDSFLQFDEKGRRN